MSAPASRIPAFAPRENSFVEQTPPEQLQGSGRSQTEQERRVHELVVEYVRELNQRAPFFGVRKVPRKSKTELSRLINGAPLLRVAFARECLADPRILNLDPTMSVFLPKSL